MKKRDVAKMFKLNLKELGEIPSKQEVMVHLMCQCGWATLPRVGSLNTLGLYAKCHIYMYFSGERALNYLQIVKSACVPDKIKIY